jgi:hypothetical protein
MLDTKVEGSSVEVTAAATWLRDTLAKKLAAAGDQQQDARNDARGRWEGETASSYQNVSGDTLKVNDKHEDRIKTVANALDAYAAKLKVLEDDMRFMRDRASDGGLTVTGTVIRQPPDVPSSEFEPGSAGEDAYTTAMGKVELWNTLVEDVAAGYQTFVDWVDSNMPGAVAKAREKDGSDSFSELLGDLAPNYLGGAGAGLSGLALASLSNDFEAQARELKRMSRVSGDPRIRGSVDTPSGKLNLDDLLSKAEWLKRGGRFLGGPGGIVIDAGFGIKDGIETGDWERATLTTLTSVGVGLGGAALVAGGVISAPAIVTVVGIGAAAGMASYGVGYVYDHWDDITDSVSDTWDNAADTVSDAWDDATDTVGDAWDSIIPW